MGFVEIQCVETGETLEFSDYSTITYHRLNDEPIRVPQGPAWCYNCQRIQIAEVFPQHIASIALSIETASRDPDSDAAFICGGSDGIKTLALELQRLKEFLSNRTTGPKCLTCFSDRIQIIPDQGEVRLPNGKHYTLGNCGFASCGLVVEFQIDVNGDKIRRTRR